MGLFTGLIFCAIPKKGLIRIASTKIDCLNLFTGFSNLVYAKIDKPFIKLVRYWSDIGQLLDKSTPEFSSKGRLNIKFMYF
jgi:hypothetical protein